MNKKPLEKTDATREQFEDEEGLPGYILAEIIYEPQKFHDRLCKIIFTEGPIWKKSKKK